MLHYVQIDILTTSNIYQLLQPTTMKILSSDFKKGNVSLHIEDLDDLWQLSHIIDPGDLVKAKTTRKVKIGNSENAKVTKKTLTLTIEAEVANESSSNYHKEFTVGSFRRQWTLPKSSNAEGIEANHKNGVLTLTIPTAEENHRTINIS